MIGRSALWVARQHGHSISTMLRFYAAWAGGAGESDVDTIRATLNSDCPLRRRMDTGGDQNATRPIVRPFELEFAPRPQAQTRRFATEFPIERDQPGTNLLKKKKIRERDSCRRIDN
jgi:hypothetical protein